MIKFYDVIVVGSDPGGFTSAFILAKSGRRVALLEAEELGGTCLNRECIPKEGLYRIAKEAYSLRRKGFEVKLDKTDKVQCGVFVKEGGYRTDKGYWSAFG